MVRAGDTLEFPEESWQVLATPTETGDRYRIRITAPPGGGPGITGDGPHIHPGLVETFRCMDGRMTVKLGRETLDLAAGGSATVTAGVVHGFVNSGTVPLIVDVDAAFTAPGPRLSADGMRMAAIIAGLIRDGRIDARTGFPSVLQLAVVMERFPEALQQPGVYGVLIKAAAIAGRLRGYRSVFPEYET